MIEQTGNEVVYMTHCCLCGCLGSDLGYNGGIGFQTMAQYLANGMQLLSEGALDADQISEFTNVYNDLMTVMNSDVGSNAAYAYNFATSLPEGISDALNGYDWNTTADTVLGAIETGFTSASDRATQIGDDVGAGIGEGEAAHDFSADAESTISNDESALRDAADSHSPAARFNPLGEDIAAGIGEGMTQHDFSADAEAVIAAIQSAMASDLFSEVGALVAYGLAEGMTSADMSSAGAVVSSNVQTAVNGNLPATTFNGTGADAMSGLSSAMTGYSFAAAGSSVGSSVKTSVSSALNSSSLISIGKNAMAGLASGIRSGTSSVVSAMRSAAQAAVSAAKSALQIHSPSRVFRDEVGAMVMRGFGAGVEKETKAQARIIGNAARYLTDAAQGGIATGSTDNRRTYNSTSTVNLNVSSMQIRDNSDIRSLAIEIASLKKRQQRGKGLRLA